MIRGKRKIINKGINKINIDVGIHNKFEIKVVDSETGKIRQEARAYNVICVGLWQAFLRNYNINPYNAEGEYFNQICFGKGEGTPSAEDTALFSQIATVSATELTSKLDRENGVYYVTKYIKLDSSQYVGNTITEVGIRADANISKLCTHAMLEDMNGNPISITKTDTDVIYIYATIYVHYSPTGYDKGSIQLLWLNSYNFIRCMAGCYPNDYNALGPFDINRFGTSGVFYTTSSSSNWDKGYNFRDGQYSNVSWTKAYDQTNKKITYTSLRMESTIGNVNGINMILIKANEMSGYYSYPSVLLKVGGDWYPYTQIENEAVGTGDGATVDFALDFQRAREVKVYIDGVETTDFTCDYGPVDANTPAYYFDYLESVSTKDNHIYKVCNPSESYSGTKIAYNPFYELGISKMSKRYYTQIWASNDLIDWVLISDASTSSTTIDIPEEYQHYKYWKGVTTSSSGGYFPEGVVWANGYDGKCLHLGTPPADGAVITVDYITDTIAKDVDHVFEFEVVFSFGEYSES